MWGRRLGWELALLVVLALLLMWQGASALSADAVVHPFAGNWSTFNGTGILTLDAQTASAGAASTAYYSDGTANCNTKTTYYAGNFRVSDDSGYFAGCTDSSGTHLMAWYKSASSDNAGTVSITVASNDLSFSGTYDQTSDGTGGAYDGTFTSDFSGSGRTAPSTTPTATTGENCLTYNVTGVWQVTQTNGYSPTFNLEQHGTQITGTQVLSAEDEARGNYTDTTSTLVGTVHGKTIDIIVTAPPKMDGVVVKGEYTGTLSESTTAGQLVAQGAAGVPGNPTADGVTWTGSGPGRCSGGWKLGLNFENANNLFSGHGEGTSCRPMGEGCSPNAPGFIGAIVDSACGTPQVRICSPGIKVEIQSWTFAVTQLTPSARWHAWRTPPMQRTLTLTVKVNGSTNTGLCRDGDVGTAVVIDRDLINSDNVHASGFSLGGWQTPCVNQTFNLNGLAAASRGLTGPPLRPGQYGVVATIACYAGNSWNPEAC
jgi:hypothetical protein